jgi:uncharacterized membrane protein (DUF106 family)
MVVEGMIFGLPPVAVIGGISALLSLGVSLVYKYGTDQTLMKELKKELKHYQTQMKAHKDDLSKVKEIQSKMMETNMKYMKQSMRPMLFTLLPFLLIFRFLGGLFGGLEIVSLPFNMPFSGNPFLGWIGTYIIFSMVFTTAFRKLFKVS